ncbi:438_t:CDS:1, partial [Cetraspora pellucida]
QPPLLSTMPILLTKLLLSDNLLLAITVDVPDILLSSAMHEDKINNFKDPDNQNKLFKVLIKTTLVMIIEINLTLEVEIITEIEVSHKTETTIDLTEPLLKNI